MAKEKIELHPCSYFDCENCGHRNIVMPIVSHPGEALWLQVAQQNNLPEEFNESLILHPEIVKCSECDSEYQAQAPHTDNQN
jgi:DNA-directed RNA polymerase subunit RPC12/RpoP